MQQNPAKNYAVFKMSALNKISDMKKQENVSFNQEKKIIQQKGNKKINKQVFKKLF